MILVDTDVLIDAARGDADAISCLQAIEGDDLLATSCITQMELLVGCRNKAELRALDKFLERFQVLALSEAISDRAVDLLRRYRLSHGLLIADSIIAATALTQNCQVVTKNRRDFQFVAGLGLMNYPSPFGEVSER